MPKEKVYDRSELFDIEIGWTRERDVQLGISTHDGRSLADWMAGRGLPPATESELPAPTGLGTYRPVRALGDDTETAQRMQVYGDGYQVTQLPQFSSLWASLDRTGINRLIKVLRRARDEAYGRDE